MQTARAQVQSQDAEVVSALGLDAFPALVVLPPGGSIVKYDGARPAWVPAGQLRSAPGLLPCLERVGVYPPDRHAPCLSRPAQGCGADRVPGHARRREGAVQRGWGAGQQHRRGRCRRRGGWQRGRRQGSAAGGRMPCVCGVDAVAMLRNLEKRARGAVLAAGRAWLLYP